MRMLITGGAGFVGGSLSRSFLREGHEVILFDNLRRRGSELNLTALTAEGNVPEGREGDIRLAAANCPESAVLVHEEALNDRR